MVWDSKIDKLKIIKVCLRVYEGGDRPMTVRSFVEGVAALKFNPGDHTFLEKIYLELRKIEVGMHKVPYPPGEYILT